MGVWPEGQDAQLNDSLVYKLGLVSGDWVNKGSSGLNQIPSQAAAPARHSQCRDHLYSRRGQTSAVGLF